MGTNTAVHHRQMHTRGCNGNGGKPWRLMVVMCIMMMCCTVMVSACWLCPFAFDGLNPKTIPYMGALVTVTGVGFSSRKQISCSAKNTVDNRVTIINDTHVICPLGRDSVTYTDLYLWDPTAPQVDTFLAVRGIKQDNSLLPKITRVYITHPSSPGIQRNYISRCTPGSRLVIEGENLPFNRNDISSIVIGSSSSSAVLSFSGAQLSRVSSSMIITNDITIPLSSFGLNQVYMNINGGATYTMTPSSSSSYASQIRSCMSDESSFCNSIADCPSLLVNDFTPSIIPYLGAMVTITGSGFTRDQSGYGGTQSSLLKCSARNGVSSFAMVVNDTTIICPLGINSVDNGNGNNGRLLIWDVKRPSYMVSLDGIRQDNSLLPKITRVYITHPSSPGIQRNYISRCTPGSRLVIEGENFGINPYGMSQSNNGYGITQVSVGDGFTDLSRVWFTGAQLSKISSRMIITNEITPSTLPLSSFQLYRVYLGYMDINGTTRYVTNNGDVYRIQSCRDRELLSCVPSADCSSMMIRDIYPRTIPYMGAIVTIVGSGFSGFNNLKCSAGQNRDFNTIPVNDSMILCPLSRNSVTYDELFVWDASLPQSSTIVYIGGIRQDNTIIPMMTNVYVTHASSPGVQRDYITRCTTGSQLVIEGTNLGVNISDTLYIKIGSSFTIVPSQISTITSTMIVTNALSTIPSAFAASLVYYGFVGGQVNTSNTIGGSGSPMMIRSCMDRQTSACSASYTCGGSLSLSWMYPRTLPYMGAMVTAIGTNFIASSPMKCSANYGVNEFNAIVINDTTLICPLKYASIGTPQAQFDNTQRFHIWSAVDQANTVKWMEGIVQDRNQLPVITSVYVTNPGQPGARLKYISQCSNGSQIIIEGTNLGISSLDIKNITLSSSGTIWLSINSSLIQSVTPTRVITSPINAPSLSWLPSSLYYGLAGRAPIMAPVTQQLSACMGDETPSCAAVATCPSSSSISPYILVDIYPKTIPFMGALVTIIGSGFLNAANLLCSAKNGRDSQVQIINDSTIICPLGINSVDNGNGMIYVWDPNVSQSKTITSINGINQDNSLLPMITNVYITHVSSPTIRRTYITRCAPGSTLVIEGTNLGISSADIYNIGGITTPDGIYRFDITPIYITSISSTLVTAVVEPLSWTLSSSPTVVSYCVGGGITGVAITCITSDASSVNKIRVCMSSDCGGTDC